MKIVFAALTALVGLSPAIADAQPRGQPAGTPDYAAPDYVAPDYAADATWLCLPGRRDACSQPLPTTRLEPTGYGRQVGVETDASPAVDCFYVYPTVSRDPGVISDLDAGPEEQEVTAAQAGRFRSVCRVFAPAYRSVTIAGLGRSVAGGPREIERVMGLAYGDVLAAWRNFRARRAAGRPFVLIGHSQGTVHLKRLLAEEIEQGPEARQLVSALLIGFNVAVPQGRVVGGDFSRTPLCTRIGQTGCVITYVSFRAASPPPLLTLFGRSPRRGMTVGCTNPATLAAGTAPLHSIWVAGMDGPAGHPVAWSSTGPAPTRFLETRDLVTGTCVNRRNLGYLAVSVNADPRDTRADTIPGDITIAGRSQAGWGIHNADIFLAQGDLVRLVREQARSFGRGRR